MINWIAGGIIFGITLYIIIRGLSKFKGGQGCSCSSCHYSDCKSRAMK